MSSDINDGNNTSEYTHICSYDQYSDFPITNINSVEFENENKLNRIGHFITVILTLWFVITFKYLITDLTKIPQFCDIHYSWEHDSECNIKCDGFAYFISKIMQFDWYLNYPFVNTYGYYNTNLLFKTKLSYFLGPSALLFTIIGHLIFYKVKVLALALAVFLTVFINLILLLKSKIYFLIAFSLSFVRFYFILVKLFFVFIYPLILHRYPEYTVKFLPIFLYILQIIYNKMVRLDIFNRYNIFLKMNINICLLTFEFINIGCIHEVVCRKSIWANEVWTNIILTFILDVDKKTLISSRIIHWIKNKLFKRKALFTLGDYEILYITQKIEFEVLTHFIYLCVIMTKYFNYSESLIVNCYGKPNLDLTCIKIDHYIMFGFHIASILLQIFIRYILDKILGLKNYFPKFRHIYDCHSYIGYYMGMCISMGLPCFYVMISQSNKTI